MRENKAEAAIGERKSVALGRTAPQGGGNGARAEPPAGGSRRRSREQVSGRPGLGAVRRTQRGRAQRKGIREEDVDRLIAEVRRENAQNGR